MGRQVRVGSPPSSRPHARLHWCPFGGPCPLLSLTRHRSIEAAAADLTIVDDLVSARDRVELTAFVQLAREIKLLDLQQ